MPLNWRRARIQRALDDLDVNISRKYFDTLDRRSRSEGCNHEVICVKGQVMFRSLRSTRIAYFEKDFNWHVFELFQLASISFPFIGQFGLACGGWSPMDSRGFANLGFFKDKLEIYGAAIMKHMDRSQTAKYRGVRTSRCVLFKFLFGAVSDFFPYGFRCLGRGRSLLPFRRHCNTR